MLRRLGRRVMDRWADLVLRSYLCFNILATIHIGVVSSFSLNRIAFTTWDGNLGWILVGLMGVLAVAGLVDIAVNDIHDDAPRVRWLREWRWLLFVMIAMCLGVLFYVNVAHTVVYSLLGRYAIDLIASTVVAGFSLVGRGGRRGTG